MLRQQKKILKYLIIGLGLAFGLRVVTALVVYGPQALDDYKHGVLPAYQWWAGVAVDLPDYRSFLLPWLLGGFLKVFAGPFHIDSALGQVRIMYLGLALISLIGFWGPYLYARTFLSQRFAAILFLLLALYPIMPFVSTRAFGESVALSFVLSGLTLAEYGRKSSMQKGKKYLQVSNYKSLLYLFIGLVLLAVATWFRFQVGLIFVVYGALLLKEKKSSFLWVLLAASALAFLGQGGIDWLSGRGAWTTLYNYLLANEGGAAQYGVSPWYNTWLLVLGMGLFPFSFLLIPDFKWIYRRHWRLLIPVLVFVLIHSITPHKEERFMYPILGVVLLLLSEGLARGLRRRLVRYVYGFLSIILIGVALPLICFNNTQVGEIKPMAEVNQRFLQGAGLIDRNSLLRLSRIQDYFVRSPSEILFKDQPIQIEFIEQQLEQRPHWQGAAVLTSDPNLRSELLSLSEVKTKNIQCGKMETAQSWSDALLYRLNPKHNQRRRPTWYILCAKEITSS